VLGPLAPARGHDDEVPSSTSWRTRCRPTSRCRDDQNAAHETLGCELTSLTAALEQGNSADVS